MRPCTADRHPFLPSACLQPLTKQLRAAARSGKGTFLLMTFKEVFDNIVPGGCCGWVLLRRLGLLGSMAGMAHR